ncbi:hypothetical protein [Streptomyces sp. WAC06128]|uniref:hypothetical protein n=1 Tax=Streptomyces sp. WAC06128 TaxID=2487426 RepID=UPI000FA953FF|nr:hypothetical protein [Streptomyces sp. WAC06128]RSS67633.1 hypothetical protein EF911_34380 [Streptomyces sp. WAC06128]
MNDDPLHARAGLGAVFKQLLQRAFDEDMRQGRLPVKKRTAGPDLVMWCSFGSGKSRNLLYILEAKRAATVKLGLVRGELDRLKATAGPEAVGGSTSPAPSFSAAKVALQLGRSFSLAARVHALHEQAAALEALLALLHCACEQLLGDARYPLREPVVRTAASPCGVIGLTTPRVPRAPGSVRLLHRTEPTAGAAAA